MDPLVIDHLQLQDHVKVFVLDIDMVTKSSALIDLQYADATLIFFLQRRFSRSPCYSSARNNRYRSSSRYKSRTRQFFRNFVSS